MNMVAALLHDSYSIRDDAGCTHLRGLFRSDLLAANHLGGILPGDRSCGACEDGSTNHVLGGCCRVEHMEVIGR